MMKQINFGIINNKDVIFIFDSETKQYKVIAELVIPLQEVREEISESIKDYVSKYKKIILDNI